MIWLFNNDKTCCRAAAREYVQTGVVAAASTLGFCKTLIALSRLKCLVKKCSTMINACTKWVEDDILLLPHFSFTIPQVIKANQWHHRPAFCSTAVKLKRSSASWCAPSLYSVFESSYWCFHARKTLFGPLEGSIFSACENIYFQFIFEVCWNCIGALLPGIDFHFQHKNAHRKKHKIELGETSAMLEGSTKENKENKKRYVSKFNDNVAWF